MKKILLLCLTTLILVLFAGHTASAQIPETFNYQAYIVANGLPLDVSTNISFSIWDTQTGGSTPIWQETQPVSGVKGYINVVLGNSNPIVLPGPAQYWLEVKVGSDNALPRIQLTAVPYALYAIDADHAVKADSAKQAGIAHDIDDNTISSAKIIDGDIHIADLGADVLTAGGDLLGTYPNPTINGAVIVSKIPAGSITRDKLDPSVLSGIPIGDAEGEVYGNWKDLKIQNLKVTEIKIAPGAVTNTKLGANAVTDDKIMNGTITGDKIAQMGANDHDALVWVAADGMWEPRSTSESLQDAYNVGRTINENLGPITITASGIQNDIFATLIDVPVAQGSAVISGTLSPNNTSYWAQGLVGESEAISGGSQIGAIAGKLMLNGNEQQRGLLGAQWVSGESNTTAAVYGKSFVTGASDWAGYFDGNVHMTGDLTGNTASFNYLDITNDFGVGGSLAVIGDITTFGTFNGNGSGLTNLPAASITGTVDKTNLPAAIAYEDEVNNFLLANTFTGAVTVNNTLFVKNQLTIDDPGNLVAPITLNSANGDVTATRFIGAFTGLATSATNLDGGAAGYVPYQSAANTTLFVPAGTPGQVFMSNGIAAPTWETINDNPALSQIDISDNLTPGALNLTINPNVITDNMIIGNTITVDKLSSAGQPVDYFLAANGDGSVRWAAGTFSLPQDKTYGGASDYIFRLTQLNNTSVTFPRATMEAINADDQGWAGTFSNTSAQAAQAALLASSASTVAGGYALEAKRDAGMGQYVAKIWDSSPTTPNGRGLYVESNAPASTPYAITTDADEATVVINNVFAGTNKIALKTFGDIVANGTIYADGSGLTNINASNITTGTIDRSHLPSSVLFTDTPFGTSAMSDITGTYDNLQLKNIMAAGGTVGSATSIPIITYDAKGRITNVNSATIDIAGQVRSALSATAPILYDNTTGIFSISQAGPTTDGYLSSTDWNTFNNKQPAGNYALQSALNAEIARATAAEGTITNNLNTEILNAAHKNEANVFTMLNTFSFGAEFNHTGSNPAITANGDVIVSGNVMLPNGEVTIQGTDVKSTLDILTNLLTQTLFIDTPFGSNPASDVIGTDYTNLQLRQIAALGTGGTVGTATSIPVITYDNKGRIINVSSAPLADYALNSDLTAEIARATAAENTLTTNLNTEIQRASDAEATITENLSDEVLRATAAEATLTANLSTEIANAAHKNEANVFTMPNTFSVGAEFNHTGSNPAITVDGDAILNGEVNVPNGEVTIQGEPVKLTLDILTDLMISSLFVDTQFGSNGGDITGTYDNLSLRNTLPAGGSVGSATSIPVLGYDAKGRITSVGAAAINFSLQNAYNSSLPTPNIAITAGNPITLTAAAGQTALAITGNEMINGLANYNDNWTVVPAGATATTLVPKGYVDTKVAGLVTLAGANMFTNTNTFGSLTGFPNTALIAYNNSATNPTMIIANGQSSSGIPSVALQVSGAQGTTAIDVPTGDMNISNGRLDVSAISNDQGLVYLSNNGSAPALEINNGGVVLSNLPIAAIGDGTSQLNQSIQDLTTLISKSVIVIDGIGDFMGTPESWMPQNAANGQILIIVRVNARTTDRYYVMSNTTPTLTGNGALKFIFAAGLNGIGHWVRVQ